MSNEMKIQQKAWDVLSEGNSWDIYILIYRGLNWLDIESPSKTKHERKEKNLRLNTCTIAKLVYSIWIGDCVSSFFFFSFCHFAFVYDDQSDSFILFYFIYIYISSYGCCSCHFSILLRWYLLAKSYQASSVSKIWLIRCGACSSAMSAKVPFVWIKNDSNTKLSLWYNQISYVAKFVWFIWWQLYCGYCTVLSCEFCIVYYFANAHQIYNNWFH